MLIKDKCWMHIGSKLILRYFLIYVIEYYELHFKLFIGFNFNDFNVFWYKVLILLYTE